MNKKLIKMALCHALLLNETGDLWLPLIPASGDFVGRDGRGWTVSDAQAIINNTELPFQLDIDHHSEITLDTSASGWFTELKVEDGNICGKLELNNKGQAVIDDKQYKYYSPAFAAHERTNEVMALFSVGLTNRPNLDVPALNAEDKPNTNSLTKTNEEKPMTPELLAALGLAPDADSKAVLNAVQALQTQSNKPPELNAYVPKATHDQVTLALNATNKQLADIKKGAHDKEVEVAINTAVADKKIAPADKEYYTAQCASESGLEAFRQFAANKVAIIGDSGLADKPPEKATELNTAEKHVFGLLNIETTSEVTK